MQKPFEDTKTFILVSDIMAWSNTAPKIKKEPSPPPPEEGQENNAPAEEKPPEEEPAENKSEDEG